MAFEKYLSGQVLDLSLFCFSFCRPYTEGFEDTDPQRKLNIPNPTLPTGEVPSGFLGYAVNMVDLEPHYLVTRTMAGHGLRETLFYCLFGELQVYQTREDMKKACFYARDGAVSLDGGIMKGNGVISFGYRYFTLLALPCSPLPLCLPRTRKIVYFY